MITKLMIFGEDVIQDFNDELYLDKSIVGMSFWEMEGHTSKLQICSIPVLNKWNSKSKTRKH